MIYWLQRSRYEPTIERRVADDGFILPLLHGTTDLPLHRSVSCPAIAYMPVHLQMSNAQTYASWLPLGSSFSLISAQGVLSSTQEG